jgi:hypothetical protein
VNSKELHNLFAIYSQPRNHDQSPSKRRSPADRIAKAGSTQSSARDEPSTATISPAYRSYARPSCCR